MTDDIKVKEIIEPYRKMSPALYAALKAYLETQPLGRVAELYNALVSCPEGGANDG